MSGITLLGLGPGNPEQLTRQAWAWLEKSSQILLRTRQHPVVAHLPAHLEILSCDDLYESGKNFDAVYEAIIQRALELGRRDQGITYAVPGHPFVAETTGPEIARRAALEGIPVQVIEGLSFLEPCFSALGVDPFPNTVLVDALDLARRHHPPFSPAQPALIAQIYSRQVASDVKLTLNAVYPDEYPVVMIHAAGTPAQAVERIPLYQVDRSRQIGLLSVLYVPPLPDDTAFEDFQDVVARLRAPDGCPWDREQTHESLRKYLLEETYEALDALDHGDLSAMREELGDLLLQIVLHAQIAVEDGEFSMADILQGINQKIRRRHPHVFGEAQVSGTEAVLQNWEKIKQDERKNNGAAEKGLLDGVPRSLPALSQAQELQDRAARVGFDWSEMAPVLAKVREELDEVLQAPEGEKRAEELGDLLFAVVNLVRWYRVDAESALRQTNQKFRDRFQFIEQRARESGRQLSEMSLNEMDVFWDEAKQRGI